ncbi:hypothetical protein M419DRAFT_122389 [Trichoderma reesei RUT C-30]|uniref:Uncharacterized protein n=1 Tax=Hypocrea jecorina (strain ATCC 56765 / BCRC 32924 / NRRL 11460 / Rut C-30) TaxID=1344414 RepID=A0A024SIT3_HYPJR|nr:hypothetical protein M419DRAFT_122389 [Trichoderma reesei RUT C-30]
MMRPRPKRHQDATTRSSPTLVGARRQASSSQLLSGLLSASIDPRHTLLQLKCASTMLTGIASLSLHSQAHVVWLEAIFRCFALALYGEAVQGVPWPLPRGASTISKSVWTSMPVCLCLQ